MRVVTRDEYGGPGVLRVVEREEPAVPAGCVAVRVRAVSLNRIDWYHVTGTPLLVRPTLGLRAPKSPEFHVDFAGTVETAGREVRGLEPGDAVFGRAAPFGDIVCVEAEDVARKPASLTFEEAACLPTAGRTALQALRDHGRVRAGDRVLVNGASGGVGTLAVQIAKALGADVTAVCSTGNVEQALSLGADRVVDYTQTDFTRSGDRHRVLFDNAGNRSWRAYTRALEPEGTLVIVGGGLKNHLVGPLAHVARIKARAALGRRAAVFFVAKPNAGDLRALADLAASGRITPAVERVFPLGELEEAFRRLGSGHARGKLVVTLD